MGVTGGEEDLQEMSMKRAKGGEGKLQEVRGFTEGEGKIPNGRRSYRREEEVTGGEGALQECRGVTGGEGQLQEGRSSHRKGVQLTGGGITGGEGEFSIG